MVKVTVKLLTGLAGVDYTWPSGSEHEIEKAWAERLVEANQATIIKAAKPKSKKTK